MRLNAPIEIDISLILPAEDNTRDITACSGKIQEYAMSMETHGVIQQLIARPHPEQEGFFQLRAGHLRLEAAKLAGLETVPVSINDFNDQQAMEITVLENLKTDLSPYEESLGCSNLIKQGLDVETVASHIGKSESWVRRRASLQSLNDKWLEMMQQGPLTRWTAGHWELIALLDTRVSEKVRKNIFNGVAPANNLPDGTIQDLRDYISERLGFLNEAPWTLQEEGRVIENLPSCEECPHNTATSLLFAEFEEEPQCQNSTCFHKKSYDILLDTINNHRKTEPSLILVDISSKADKPDKEMANLLGLPEIIIYGTNAVGFPEYDEKEGYLPGLVVNNSSEPLIRWFKVTEPVKADTEAAKDPESDLKHKRAKLNDKRCAAAVSKLEEIVKSPMTTAQVFNDPFGLISLRLALNPLHDEDHNKTFEERFAAYEELDKKELMLMAFKKEVPELAKQLSFSGINSAPSKLRVAEFISKNILGTSFKELLDEAVIDVPETPAIKKLVEQIQDTKAGLKE